MEGEEEEEEKKKKLTFVVLSINNIVITASVKHISLSSNRAVFLISYKCGIKVKLFKSFQHKKLQLGPHSWLF